MSRRRPPDRRDGELFTFDHDGVSYIAQFSRDGDGQPYELFLTCGKEGTTANIVAQECAVILSIAVQCGTPLSTLFDALPKLADGRPAGPVGMALAMIAAKPGPKPILTVVEKP
jgi:hypothetical protein